MNGWFSDIQSQFFYFFFYHTAPTRMFFSSSNSLFHNPIIVNLVSLFIDEIGDVPLYFLLQRANFHGYILMGCWLGEHSSLKTISI